MRALARHPERDGSQGIIEGVEIIQGDITGENRMRDMIQGCKIVFHAAGVADGSMETQRRVNVGGTRNIIRAAAQAGVERVVHVSSAGAYGFGWQGDLPKICRSSQVTPRMVFQKLKAKTWCEKSPVSKG